MADPRSESIVVPISTAVVQPDAQPHASQQAVTLNAAFSIALAIRGRTVALDTELLDNLTDGTLRLLIGVISAGVLLVLLASGTLPPQSGMPILPAAAWLGWLLAIGFVGGFLERLVPDLRVKRNAQTGGNGTSGAAGTIK